MKLRASGQDLRVTLISAGSIPGKRDIELQSETRTWAVFGCTSSLSSLYLCKGIARVWQEILSRVYKENARCSLLLDFCLCSSFSFPVTVSLFSYAAFHALLPSLDISDSKHNSNPGGLYARRGNSSVATQSSTLIEISYPLTYLPNPPPRICLASSPEHPTSRILPTAGVSHYTSPASSLLRLQHLRSVLWKTVYGRNGPFPDDYSEAVRNGLTPRNACAKYLESCERSRESEGKFTVPKEVCEVRRYCTYLRRLRNVKDVKDRDGVLNSSGGTREKIDYIFINFFFCARQSTKKLIARFLHHKIFKWEFDILSAHYTSQRAIDTFSDSK